MPTRRGKGEGSIFKDKAGRYRAFVTVGYSSAGKQIKKWVYGQTRHEAAQKLAKLLPSSGAGLVNLTRVTVGEWLERWSLEQAAIKNLAANTQRNHKNYLERIKPKLGRVRLASLNATHLRALYAELGPGSHARHIHDFIAGALRDARRAGLIDRVATDDVDPPASTPKRPGKALRIDQVMKLLEAVKGSRFEVSVHLALSVGLRPGELLALRWKDLQPPFLNVPGTKTEAAARVVQLDPDTLELLEHHRLEQAKVKHAFRKSWKNHGLIFPSVHGTPWSHRNYRRDLYKLLEGAEVDTVRPHNLRHTYVSLAVPVVGLKEVSERVGHSDARFTAAQYQHLAREDRARSAKSLKELLEHNQPKKKKRTP